MGKFLKNVKKCRVKGNAIIAEIKAVSPTLGDLMNGRSVQDLVEAYESGGACAVSYITSPFFGGSLEALREICSITELPVLRKDFIVTKDEIEKTAEAEGDAVLLISRILKESTAEFVDFAREHGIESVVEVHSINDIEYAINSESPIIGINNRDIAILEKDDGSIEVTEKLSPLIDSHALKISESGIQTRKHVERALRYADAILVGTAFMKAENIERKVLEFVGDENA